LDFISHPQASAYSALLQCTDHAARMMPIAIRA
jgi:hypothetical protein